MFSFLLGRNGVIWRMCDAANNPMRALAIIIFGAMAAITLLLGNYTYSAMMIVFMVVGYQMTKPSV